MHIFTAGAGDQCPSPPSPAPAAQTGTPLPQQVNPMDALRLVFASQPHSDTPPVRVMMAMSFVRLCNEHMGYWGIGAGGMRGAKLEVRQVELPPCQEGALRMACACLGNYFAGKDVSDEFFQATEADHAAKHPR